jgi:hypothetical protein
MDEDLQVFWKKIQQRSLFYLKRRTRGDIQTPQIYNIIITQLVDILAESSEKETLREFHSFFHVTTFTKQIFDNSIALARKREVYNFEKCLEGFSRSCELTVTCPELQKTYTFIFRPSGRILTLSARALWMVSPKEDAKLFKVLRQRYDSDGWLSFEAPGVKDFHRIFCLLHNKLRHLPVRYIWVHRPLPEFRHLDMIFDDRTFSFQILHAGHTQRRTLSDHGIEMALKRVQRWQERRSYVRGLPNILQHKD